MASLLFLEHASLAHSSSSHNRYELGWTSIVLKSEQTEAYEVSYLAATLYSSLFYRI